MTIDELIILLNEASDHGWGDLELRFLNADIEALNAYCSRPVNQFKIINGNAQLSGWH